jgi:hypothetical protein
LVDTVNQIAKAAFEARQEWLEDVLSGLLINDVLPHEIGVEHWPGGVVKVRVRGEVKYEHKFAFV